ncbi:hypothetical protein LXA43DRAFT_1065551 [Ganoderma leucocontextum]|nr:hypothetical protein LXA43DRAFT_1065551 [Ganoderma leucocontextum]
MNSPELSEHSRRALAYGHNAVPPSGAEGTGARTRGGPNIAPLSTDTHDPAATFAVAHGTRPARRRAREITSERTAAARHTSAFGASSTPSSEQEDGADLSNATQGASVLHGRGRKWNGRPVVRRARCRRLPVKMSPIGMGLEEHPTAVQGRFGGAKGLWVLHPRDQSIFDLLAPPGVTLPSRLLRLTILTLMDNGVQNEIFVELMRETIEEVKPLVQWTGPKAIALLWKAVKKALGLVSRSFQDYVGNDEPNKPLEGLAQEIVRLEGDGNGEKSALNVVLFAMSILEDADNGADPYGVFNAKDVGDLNPHLLLGDVLVIVLYHVGYSDPLNHFQIYRNLNRLPSDVQKDDQPLSVSRWKRIARQSPHLSMHTIAVITFGGCSESNGQHYVLPGPLGPHSTQYPAHATNTNWREEFRDEYMRLIMDLLTWHDRVFGGATFLVSTQAARRPGPLSMITAVKMDVFLPSMLLREQPRTCIVFARMVQYFAEEVGLPTMRAMDKANPPRSKLKGVQTVAAVAVPCVDTQPLIPPSETPWHTFYGRDPGVLERLIAERIAVVDAVPEIPSMTLRPSLQPLVSEGVTLPAPSSSAAVFGKRKCREREPWTAADIKHYAKHFEGCGEHDDAGRRAIAEQISTRLPDVFGVIADLERRVEDLAAIKQIQLVEIESLRQALQESLDQRRMELLRIKEELTPPGPLVPEPSSPRRPLGEARGARSGRRSGAATTGNSESAVSIPSVTPPPSMINARGGERNVMSMPPPHAVPPSLTRNSIRHSESRSDPGISQAAGGQLGQGEDIRPEH